MKFFSVLFMVTLSTAVQALAAPIFTSKDWTLDDQGNYCVASTTTQFQGQSIRFEAALEKSGRYPVEFYVRPTTEVPTTLAFTVPLDERRKIIYSLTRLPQASGQPDVFWMVPRATDSFVTFIRQSSALPIRLIEAAGAKAFSFSLAGSTAVMEQLQVRCHPQKNIDILSFEKIFLPNLVTTLDPRKVMRDHTEKLRTSYLNGFKAFQEKTSSEAQLTKLRQDFAKQTKELEEVIKTLAKLEGKDLPPLNAKRTELETKITQIESQITQKQQSIDQQNQLRAPAQAELDAAEAVIAPFRPEHNRRAELVATAQRSLDRAQSRLSEIDSRISRLESEITSLNIELGRLRSQITSKRSELVSAESAYRDAERNNDRFNENSEYQDRIRRDSRHSSTKWDIEQTERNLQGKQQERNRNRREVDQARNALRQCQSQQGANCITEQGNLTRAESNLRSVESDISRLEWNLRSKQDDLRRIEERISSDVRNEKQQLERREDEARSRYSGIQVELSQLESRAANISQFDIPSRQNELSGLRAERPAVSQEIRSSQADLSQRQSELETWKRSVDYDTKAVAYKKAKDKVDLIDSAIAGFEREKARLVDSLNVNRTELAKVIAAQDKVKAEILKFQTRKAELDAALAGFNQEQARLTGAIKDAETQVAQYKKEFADALPN